MTDPETISPHDWNSQPPAGEEAARYGIGPFTLREVIFLGLSAIVLIASFLPFVSGLFVGYQTVWAPFSWFVVPGLLFQLAAAILMVLRRLVPSVRWRVGSLSVDQFASAAVLVTAAFYFGMLVFITSVPGLLGVGVAPGPGAIVGLIASVLSLAVTTLAMFIPPFRDEFLQRPETAAHPTAREPIAVPRRPKPHPAPQTTGQQDTAGYAQGVEYGQPAEHALAGQDTWAGGYGQTAEYGQGVSPAADDVGPRYARTPATEPPAEATAAEAASTAGADHPGEAESADEERTDTAREQAADDEESAVDELLAELNSEAVDETPRADDTSAPVEEPVPGEEPLEQDLAPDEWLDDEQADAAEPRAAFSHVSAHPAVEEHSAPQVVSTQPFWVYSAVPRVVVDETTGAPLFEIGPTAWALAIVDRGTELVIRHDDGRVGVLRHVDGLMRG
ncbi:hypothetical protein GCM10027416_21710 [Okibacterium endophyticum]